MSTAYHAKYFAYELTKRCAVDPASRCAECGTEDRVAKILQISVMTGDDDVLRESYDELDWLDMIRTLDWAMMYCEN